MLRSLQAYLVFFTTMHNKASEQYKHNEVPQVLFHLNKWENWDHTEEFCQDAKDRVVRVVEDRILAENMSMQEAC